MQCPTVQDTIVKRTQRTVIGAISLTKQLRLLSNNNCITPTAVIARLNYCNCLTENTKLTQGLFAPLLPKSFTCDPRSSSLSDVCTVTVTTDYRMNRAWKAQTELLLRFSSEGCWWGPQEAGISSAESMCPDPEVCFFSAIYSNEVPLSNVSIPLEDVGVRCYLGRHSLRCRIVERSSCLCREKHTVFRFMLLFTVTLRKYEKE